MKYNEENIQLWNRLRYAAGMLGTDIEGLNKALCLAEGTLEIMEKYGVMPEGELLARLRRLLGATGKELLYGQDEGLSIEAVRNLLMLKKADFDKPYRDMENVIKSINIYRPAGDDREFVGILVRDELMSDAHIHKGDYVIICRQALAENGELVAAEVEGETVIRRLRCKKDLIWLETESGGTNSVVAGDSLGADNRRIRIWGKVMWILREADIKA